MGKTRLALALAHRQLPNFKDGVFFVPLQAVSNGDGLISEIALQLGISFSNAISEKDHLIAVLKDKQMMLVLDNFEQLIDYANIVKEIIESSADINIVVTSREKLGVIGEITLRLSGLADDSDATLFIESLYYSQPNLTLDVEAHEQIRHICELVEGMPLALVLAANWIDVLSLSEIADEIANSLDLLAEHTNNTQGIRAVFDRTWTRLTQKQRHAFQALSVFSGGFTRESASAVAKANIIILKQLIDKSLIQQVDNGRYTIHELLRQYAYHHLQESNMFPLVLDRHMQHFSEFVASRESIVKGKGQLDALEELVADFSNIESAWDYATKLGHADVLLAQMECLFYIANYRNIWHTYKRILTHTRKAILNNSVTNERLRILIDMHLHEIVRFMGLSIPIDFDIETVQSWTEATKQCGTDHDYAISLMRLSDELHHDQPNVQSVSLAEQALAIFRQIGDTTRQVRCLEVIGICFAQLNQLDKYLEYSQKALILAQSVGNEFAMLYPLRNIAETAVTNAQAINQWHQLLALARKLNHKKVEARVLSLLTFAIFRAGQFDKMPMYSELAYRLAYELALPFEQAWASLAMAYTALANNRFDDVLIYAHNGKTLFVKSDVRYSSLIADILHCHALCGLHHFTKAKQQLAECLLHPFTALHPHWIKICANFATIIMVSEGQYHDAIRFASYGEYDDERNISWKKKWQTYQEALAQLRNSTDTKTFQTHWQFGIQLHHEQVLEELQLWVNESQ